ncbi:hypothetical protein ABK040_009689 [Willaertia magna]
MNKLVLVGFLVVVLMGVSVLGYQNCKEIDGNFFEWSIEGNVFKARAVLKGAAKGWGGIGFRSGLEYLEPVPVDAGRKNAYMDKSTIYIGFKDTYRKHYFQEYRGYDDAIPKLLNTNFVTLGYTRTSNLTNDLHIVMERPLEKPSNAPDGYFTFSSSDATTSLLIAKNTDASPNGIAGLDDMMRHTYAEIIKFNFFGSSSCSTQPPVLPAPQEVLPSNYFYEPTPSNPTGPGKKSSARSDISTNSSFFIAIILYVLSTFTFVYFLN